MRPFGFYHAFAIERVPHRLVFQAGGVAARDGGIAQMKMIAMGMGELGDDDIAVRRRLEAPGMRAIACSRVSVRSCSGLSLAGLCLVGMRGPNEIKPKENGRTIQPGRLRQKQSDRPSAA